MTSLPTIGPEHPPHLEGRTVRDIVEYSPDQVGEVWCRKIFRHILQSLELQYGMHMPRRAITPDTIVFHDNGQPLLIPSELPLPKRKDGEPDDPLRDDLTALASVVHYAITHELAPTGPLRGRALEGYSDSLVAAVDRCMAPDPAERPRTIADLRDILGIVALGPAGAPPPAVPAAAAAPAMDTPLSFMREADDKRPGTGLSLWQRRAIAAGAGAILLAVAVAWFAELRDTTSYDHIVLTLPQQPDAPRAPATAAPATPPPLPAAPAGPAPVTAAAASAPAPAPIPAAPAQPATAPIHTGQAVYRLQIQPWGIVYVDGVDRGVSPPIKRLELAPGRHTVRVANPNFNDRVLEVDTAGGDGRIAVDFNLEAP